jgi:hypothetical protein
MASLRSELPTVVETPLMDGRRFIAGERSGGRRTRGNPTGCSLNDMPVDTDMARNTWKDAGTTIIRACHDVISIDQAPTVVLMVGDIGRDRGSSAIATSSHPEYVAQGSTIRIAHAACQDIPQGQGNIMTHR